jgi:hypothetical protein
VVTQNDLSDIVRRLEVGLAQAQQADHGCHNVAVSELGAFLATHSSDSGSVWNASALQKPPGSKTLASRLLQNCVNSKMPPA